MSNLFNHVFAFSFSVTATDPIGTAIPADQLRTAIIRHLAAVDDPELRENIGEPHDTHAVSATTAKGQWIMTSIANHTFTPWKVVASETGHITVQSGEYIVADVGGFGDGVAPSIEANALFIVRACNVHDGLVHALETFIEDIDGRFGEVPDDCEAYHLATAALALAKGGV